MELQCKITGILLIILALSHIAFPRYFNWTKELRTVSLINKQMMYVHAFFIALIVLLMGVLCLTCSTELITTKLGNKITLGLSVFWIARLLIQFFWYSSELWKGKKFETTMHLFFSTLWIYLSFVFLALFWESRPL